MASDPHNPLTRIFGSPVRPRPVRRPAPRGPERCEYCDGALQARAVACSRCGGPTGRRRGEGELRWDGETSTEMPRPSSAHRLLWASIFGVVGVTMLAVVITSVLMQPEYSRAITYAFGLAHAPGAWFGLRAAWRMQRARLTLDRAGFAAKGPMFGTRAALEEIAGFDLGHYAVGKGGTAPVPALVRTDGSRFALFAYAGWGWTIDRAEADVLPRIASLNRRLAALRAD